MPIGVAAERGPATDQLRAVEGLELLEARAVEDAGQHLAHVEGHPHVDRGDAQVLGRVQRFDRRSRRLGAQPLPVQVSDDAPGHGDGLVLVPGQVVAQPRGAGMHEGAAQLLLIGLLADGHLDQRRATEKDAGPALDHDRVVAHAGQVGPAGGGGAEDDADGRNALGRELGQAAELLAPGHEDIGLARQVGSARLDHDHQGQPVDLGHVHGPQQLLDGGGAGGAAPHRRVVGDDQALGLGDLGQGHHHTAADRVLGLQAGQRAELEHRGARGRPGPRGARAPSSCPGTGGARRRRRPRPPAAGRAAAAPRRPGRHGLRVGHELLAVHGQPQVSTVLMPRRPRPAGAWRRRPPCPRPPRRR